MIEPCQISDLASECLRKLKSVENSKQLLKPARKREKTLCSKLEEWMTKEKVAREPINHERWGGLGSVLEGIPELKTAITDALDLIHSHADGKSISYSYS